MKKIMETLIISLINICLISTGYAIPEDNNTSIDTQNSICSANYNLSNMDYTNNNQQTTQNFEYQYFKTDNYQQHIKKEDHRRRRPWQLNH
ncbi:hypothetical protein [uncultured Methanobrevibacter sp.]|uniref:hypothetical protein n=1 Tax=uncultured Methanobrevibacter sp. TaxID=253161 RepID=UPI00260593D6|nr:hypothetical protein [uncultured Methanobrevibacter sp.]